MTLRSNPGTITRHIAETARRLFAERGFEGVTVAEETARRLRDCLERDASR